jgi:ketose-bisphosphate aldolase
MPLVTLKSVLYEAAKGNYAVGSFNFFGLENLQGIIEAAADKRSPVSVQISAGTVKHIGEKCTCKMTEGISGDYGTPVVLHLDHAADYDLVRRCIDNGFSSVMIDGSNKPFEENAELTARVVEYAMKYGVSVEAELGHVGGNEDGISIDERRAFFTDPQKALEFVRITGIDALAVAVGTVHGFYREVPKLDFDRIREIHELLPDIPLVLHGGTGIPDDDIRRSIPLGIRKLNIGTELWYCGYGNVMKKYAALMPENGDPRKVMAKVREESKAIAGHKMDVLGSGGRL